MTVLRSSDASKMSKKEKEEKIKELKFELIKAKVSSQKSKVPTKEIKKAIARLITFAKADKTQPKREK